MSLKKIFLALAVILAITPVLAGAAEKPDGKVDAAKVARVKAQYEAQLKANGFKPGDLQVYSIGKSHIDLAWKWRKEQTRDEKCPATFRNAINHSLQFPGFSYTQSSVQYYEWAKEVDPQLFSEMQKAEKDGRWHLAGGMWNEPDGNMPEGESFARQFLYGQRFFLENFGHTTDICWMEDSFGYNWNLPQFAAKGGEKYMFTAKPTWNGHNIFPFHLFQWQAPDGSQVLTHITSTVGGSASLFPTSEIALYGRDDYVLSDLSVVNGRFFLGKYRQTRYLLKQGASLVANYLTSPDQIKAVLTKEMMPVMAIFYGTGDGGHGPLVKEIENQVALQQLGYAKLSGPDELFSAFEKYANRIPVWNDEMYLEYHQGVTTTHEWVKRMNRGSEALMRTAESVASAAFLFGADYPKDKITQTWEIILLNQFHDILPGSAIAEVYQDSAVDFAKVAKDGNEVIDSAMGSLADKIDTHAPASGLEPLVVFNPLGWDRTDMVKVAVPANAQYRVFDAAGQELLSQVAATEEGGNALYFKPGVLPGLGWKTVFLKSSDACSLPGPVVKDGADKIEIANDLVSIVIDKKSGLLLSLYDQGLKKESSKAPATK